MAMKSMAKKSGKELASPKEVYYPSVSFELKQMPMLKGKDIDDEITCTMKLKVKSISKYGDGDTNYSLDVIACDMAKNKEE